MQLFHHFFCCFKHFLSLKLFSWFLLVSVFSHQMRIIKDTSSMTFSINFSSGVLSFSFSVLDANHKAHTHTLCPNNTNNTFLFSAVLSEYTYIHIRKPKQTPTHTHPHACTPPKELPFTMFRHKLTDIPRCLSLLGHLLSLSLSFSFSPFHHLSLSVLPYRER